ncbi:ribokinase [Prauserella halophila]|uniref:Ribokinase n=1 Tax=Prauserella halophila TaxID=185641 RepID=A0ABN1WI99_9PSEU|nr:ribokinase [Prauserella halophila]MCP2236688.1 ribokinase [Prauserella halophila]
MTAAVLVVGSANADLVVATDRRPAGGETVLGGDTRILPGGKGANTAVAAARLGADVALIGAVGDDAHGRLLLDSLRGSGVGTDRVLVVDRPTGAAYITVTPDGENSILVSPGANHAPAPADVGDPAGAKVLVASLEVPIDVVEHAIAAAARAGVRTVLNLSPTAKLSDDTLRALDVLVVNEHEASWLLGTYSAGSGDSADSADSGADSADAADGADGANSAGAADHGRLLDLGPDAVVITRGPDGAVVATRDEHGRVEQITVASPQVTAVDTTGAGDAFAGALATWLASGATVADAARRAAEVAAVSVTKRGAQPSYPQLDDLS